MGAAHPISEVSDDFKLLLLDIETAPHRVYAWGLFDQTIAINQIVEPGYTLCWSAKWLGKRDLMFDSIHKSGKRAMVRRIYRLMEEADAIAHYNGLKFDIPTLNQEFLQLKLTPPKPSAQIDLYITAKRRFKFASNKLDYVAQTLKLGAKLPHKGMELWHRCMQGDAAAWNTMERYNKQDVRLLERVYLKLLPWIKDHPNRAMWLKNLQRDYPACSHCASKNLYSEGWRRNKAGLYRAIVCKDCGNHMRSSKADNYNPQLKPKRSLLRDVI